MGENWRLVYLLWVYIGVAIMKSSMKVLQKIKNKATIWSSNTTTGYLSKGIEIRISIRYMHFYVHCNIIDNSQDMETIYESIDGRMNLKQKCYLHTIKYSVLILNKT